MFPLQIPRRGDVVVRKDSLEGAPVYVLYTVPGPDQYLVRTREDAAAFAAAFATRTQVQAWFTDGGAVFVPLVSRRRILHGREHSPAIHGRGAAVA